MHYNFRIRNSDLSKEVCRMGEQNMGKSMKLRLCLTVLVPVIVFFITKKLKNPELERLDSVLAISSFLILLITQFGTVITDFFNKNFNSHKKKQSVNLDPKDYDFFIGRESYINKIKNFVLNDDRTDDLIAMVVYSAGGVGKTALIRNIDHCFRKNNVIDNVIWLRNKGSTYQPISDQFVYAPPAYANYEMLIGDLALKMNVEFATIDLSKSEERIKERLRKGKFVVILDGIEDSNRYETIVAKLIALFPWGTKSRLLITSREHIQLDRVQSVELYPFSLDETNKFILKFSEKKPALQKQLNGLENSRHDYQSELHKICKGNPLTLKVLLSNLIFSDYQKLIQRIKNQDFKGLNHYLYLSTWNRLMESNPNTIQVLKLLHDDSDTTGWQLDSIAAILGKTEPEIKIAINDLIEASMIEIEKDRDVYLYRLHSEIRSFVKSMK